MIAKTAFCSACLFFLFASLPLAGRAQGRPGGSSKAKIEDMIHCGTVLPDFHPTIGHEGEAATLFSRCSLNLNLSVAVSPPSTQSFRGPAFCFYDQIISLANILSGFCHQSLSA